MHVGKRPFAQLMDFLPWTTFLRIVARYGGDRCVRTISYAEQYRAMAFSQLTYRDSLCDIEPCLSVRACEIYHMGFRELSGVRPWPMPTSGATGAFTRTWLAG